MASIIRFHELGAPDVLRLEEIAVDNPGPGEVRLAIEAIGVNRAEAAMRGGHYIMTPTLPARIGSEASALVTAIGEGVTGWSVGDRVCTLPVPVSERYATYASETLYPANRLIARPSGLDAVQSAASWVAFMTAWGGLVEQAAITADDTVVITAASSSVGLAALQVAREAGATVIATTRGTDKAAQLAAFHAGAVIASDEQEVAAEILRLTENRGASLIFDPVSGPFAERLAEALAESGTLMIYGGLSKQPVTFPRQLAIRRNLTMRGFNFNPMVVDPQRCNRAVAAIGPNLASGVYRMPIAQTFPLAQAAEAHRTLESNAHIGKIVLTV